MKEGVTYDIHKILKEISESLNINNIMDQSQPSDIHTALTKDLLSSRN